jgi:hypothetical protein
MKELTSDHHEERPVGRRSRAIALVVLGAAVLSAAALSAPRFTGSSASKSADQRQQPEGTRDPSLDPTAQSDTPCVPSKTTPTVMTEGRKGRGGTTGTEELEQVRAEVQELKGQRSALRDELRTVERAIKEKDAPEAYEFDLTKDQWKELAASGRIKYRVPCQMSPNWTMGESLLNDLGLSLDDREPIADAFRRSSARMWATIKPMCARIVRQDEVVELLGFNGCSTLIEQEAQKKDRMAIYDTQVSVAEVRAGLREAPRDASPLQQMYLALTAEGGLFEADLAESFGPEQAQRIWHSFPCAKTVQ